MAEADIDTTVNMASWGFRLTVQSNELTAKTDRRAYDSRTRKKRLLILFFGIVFSSVLYVGEIARLTSSSTELSSSNSPGISYISAVALKQMTRIFSLLWPSLPLLLVLQTLYPGEADLRCTTEAVQVTRMFWGRVMRVQSFPVADVRRVQYVTDASPWFGRPSCLGFLAAGKQVTCLLGLKCTEAQRILDELQRLGYDVVRNPEMPFRHCSRWSGQAAKV